MNFEKILEYTYFEKKEILLISFFSLGLKNVDDFFFSETKNKNHSFTIISDKIYYIFIKFNNNKKMSLISIDGEIHTEYFIDDTNIIPYLSYFKINGELSGKGSSDRITVKRKTFQTLYTDYFINIHAVYPELTKKINSVLICVESNEIKKENEMTKTNRNIKYFEIKYNDNNKKRNNINLLNKYFNKNIIISENKELEEVFKQYINCNNIYSKPYEKEMIKSYQDFSSFYNMLNI